MRNGLESAKMQTAMTGTTKVGWGLRDDRPCKLAPLEAFSDDIAPDGYAVWLQPDYIPRTGCKSTTVEAVFGSRCCGYKTPPTGRELYEAMRRMRPTTRDKTVLRAWLMEASERDWFLAWSEQVYSWRMLANAIKQTKCARWDQIRRLNRLAKRPELVDRDAFPAER